jgi:threonylcarbamoyladenosine tRNA methylthiotransferase MtaB
MRAAFHTLGCKVNQYETEAIREEFAARGAETVGEDEPADVYIVNTCTVTNIADRKSRQYIRRMKKLNPDAIMVVTGCYAQVAAEDLEAMPEVDMIIGNNLKSTICDRVYEEYERRRSGAPEQSSAEVDVIERSGLTSYEDQGIVKSTESSMTRAYIKIEEGCDRFCSYCLIPFARGTVRSRAPGSVLEEARVLVGEGYRELVLTGINTALYGTEPGFDFERLPGEEKMSGLEVLLSRLDAMEGDFRVRLSSLEPNVVDVRHVEKIIRFRRLCHHLHLSVQSGSDSVLRRMNRHYTRDEYLEIVSALRAFDPLYGITTDIIVGFPGETEEDFADSVDIVKKAGFGRVHVFRYSPRKGTAAAAMDDAVPGNVKNDRMKRLVAFSKETADDFYRRNFGVPQRVMVEEHADGFAMGYTDNYIKVYIRDEDRSAAEGEFLTVVLTGIFNDGCLAEAAGKGR